MSKNKQAMAWNEPGKKGSQDPWGGKNAKPDLDELFKKMRSKWRKSNDGRMPSFASRGPTLITIFVLLFVFYIISGVFIVDPLEQAVILQFGKYKKTVGPGPHWIPRLVDSAIKINVQGIQTYAYQSDMLTKDENIVNVSVAVQYRIANPEKFLINVANPILSLQQATASALRQVIGNTDLDQVLTSGREEVSVNIHKQLVNILDKYQTGIEITEVALQPAKAPDAVKEAFDDAIKAQEDEQRYINQAEAYRMQVIPQARGTEQRMLADADAYKQQVVLNAQGETARYLALLPQYLQNPRVTRERLYLSSIQNVLTQTTKIFVDAHQGSNTMMYLPLDKLFEKEKQGHNMIAGKVPPSSLRTAASTDEEQENDNIANAIKKTNLLHDYGNASNDPYSFLTKGNQE